MAKPMPVRTARKHLRRMGWEFARTRGSHEIWKREDKTLTFASAGSKDLDPAAVADIEALIAAHEKELENAPEETETTDELLQRAQRANARRMRMEREMTARRKVTEMPRYAAVWVRSMRVPKLAYFALVDSDAQWFETLDDATAHARTLSSPSGNYGFAALLKEQGGQYFARTLSQKKWKAFDKPTEHEMYARPMTGIALRATLNGRVEDVKKGDVVPWAVWTNKPEYERKDRKGKTRTCLHVVNCKRGEMRTMLELVDLEIKGGRTPTPEDLKHFLHTRGTWPVATEATEADEADEAPAPRRLPDPITSEHYVARCLADGHEEAWEVYALSNESAPLVTVSSIGKARALLAEFESAYAKQQEAKAQEAQQVREAESAPEVTPELRDVLAQLRAVMESSGVEMIAVDATSGKVRVRRRVVIEQELSL